MATAATAAKLAPFEGKEVVKTTVQVTNAGDGLSQAMDIEPVELHHGDRHYLVLEVDVAKVRFDPIKDAPSMLERVHILKAGVAVLIDRDVVSDAIAGQKRKIDEAKGLQQLEGMDERPGGGVPDDIDAQVAREEEAAARQQQAHADKVTDIGKARGKPGPKPGSKRTPRVPK